MDSNIRNRHYLIINNNEKIYFILFIKGENFSEFACGTFNKNQRIPDDQNKIDVFDILRTNLAYQMSGNKNFIYKFSSDNFENIYFFKELLAEAVNSNDIEATANAKKLYQSCLNESIKIKLLDF